MTTTLEDISDTQCNYTLHAPLSIGCPVRIPISPVVKPYIPIASWTPLTMVRLLGAFVPSPRFSDHRINTGSIQVLVAISRRLPAHTTTLAFSPNDADSGSARSGSSGKETTVRRYGVGRGRRAEVRHARLGANGKQVNRLELAFAG